MGRSKRRIKMNNDSEATFELDLAPMLALMVTLIPIMLLATSFVKVRVIGTTLPQAVKEAIQQDKNNKEKIVSIDLKMNTDNFQIVVKEDDVKVLEKMVLPKNSEWDYEGLHKALYEVKKQFPKKYTINIYPEKSVPYNEIVKAIDEAREAKKEESMFTVFDKAKNNNIQTRVMFPEVNFSGLLGG